MSATFNRLGDIANGLQGLGTKDITDHEVVKKLLQSLDSSFDSLVLIIRERFDFKVLDSADIMERLNTQEEQEEEKRERSMAQVTAKVMLSRLWLIPP